MKQEKSIRADARFSPRNPVAAFTDEYGDEQIIHRPKGRRLSVYKGGNTPALLMNRAVAVLLGQNIRRERERCGMTMKELGEKCGLCTGSPKQYIYHIETGFRKEGVRLGTLFVIAEALGVAPQALLPSFAEAADLAGVSLRALERVVS